ncbi:MAG: response regulator, partial [Desulfobulbus sp.]|nr:response regulator [Desulfobulbus sp.]
AQRSDQPVSRGISLLLILLSMLFAMTGWFGVRYRRLKNRYRDVQNRLQVAEEVIDHAPLPIARFDSSRVIVTANHAIRQAHPDTSLTGNQICAFYPDLEKRLDTLASQRIADQQDEIPCTGSAVTVNNQPVEQHVLNHGKLVIVRNGNNDQGIWYGLPETMENKDSEGAGDLHNDKILAKRMTDEIIANINHELRTPMNAIIGYSEMLAKSRLESREQRFVTNIHKSSLALVSLLNDIMDLSKIDSGRLQISTGTMQLSTLVSTVESLFESRAEEKGVELLVTVAEQLPEAFICDGARLRQVLQNLISNALKFTHQGSVELLIEGIPSSTQPGYYNVRFIVQDTGIGIQPSEQQKICKLFAHDDNGGIRQYEGVRLGLTLCGRLIALMGVNIELHSTVGQGTRFTIHLHLPAVHGETMTERSEAKTPDSGPQGKRRILVVDDVDIIKEMFTAIFHGTSYVVQTAGTGEDALRIIQIDRPDLVFMDLNLSGGLDGRDTVRKIRQNPVTASIPVVCMTGELLEKPEYQSLFDGFLQKPFHLEALKETVEFFISSVPERQNGAVEDADVDRKCEVQLTQIVSVWNDALEKERQQAVSSGRLADVAAFAAAMIRHGRIAPHPVLGNMGEELLLHVQELNIQGIERVFALLAALLPRSIPS